MTLTDHENRDIRGPVFFLAYLHTYVYISYRTTKFGTVACGEERLSRGSVMPLTPREWGPSIPSFLYPLVHGLCTI